MNSSLPTVTVPSEAFLPGDRQSVGLSGTVDRARQERMRAGQCPSCGQQLYKPRKKLAFFKFKSEIGVLGRPLSVPGQVERGQCLRCSSQDDNHDEDLDSYPSLVGEHTTPQLDSDESVSVGRRSEDGNYDRGGASSQGLPFLNLFNELPVTGTNNLPTVTVTGSSDSTNAVYTGLFNQYGERHGDGVLSWTSGDRYVGSFFNGNRHGLGTLCFADGSEYVGEWECNFMHGVGTRRYPNGDVYQGSYFNGNRHGHGRFYFANGDLYVGSWQGDQMNGAGRYYYSKGQRFEGRFRNGRRHGPGKMQRKDGSLDFFVYENGVRKGTGVHWSLDRTKVWQCDVRGRIKKKLTVEEALTIAYELEGTHGLEQEPQLT